MSRATRNLVSDFEGSRHAHRSEPGGNELATAKRDKQHGTERLIEIIVKSDSI